MKPNAVKMLHLNKGHLSPKTLGVLKDKAFQRDYMVTPLPFGSFLTTDSLMSQSPRHMPDDLLHVLRYAGANDIEAIMITEHSERQIGLPFYGGNDSPDLKGTGIDEGDLVSRGGISAVDHEKLTASDLKVEQTWTETLPDADFEAPDGVWIGAGKASVRIKTDEEGTLHINAYPRGREMEDPVHSVALSSDWFENHPSNDAPDI